MRNRGRDWHEKNLTELGRVVSLVGWPRVWFFNSLDARHLFCSAILIGL